MANYPLPEEQEIKEEELLSDYELIDSLHDTKLFDDSILLKDKIIKCTFEKKEIMNADMEKVLIVLYGRKYKFSCVYKSINLEITRIK